MKERQRHISADSSYSTASSIGYESDETPKKVKLFPPNRPKTGDQFSRFSKEKAIIDRDIWKRQEQLGSKRGVPHLHMTNKHTLNPVNTPQYGNNGNTSVIGSAKSQVIEGNSFRQNDRSLFVK